MVIRFRPCVKRRTRDDPAIAALIKALQDEHDIAVAMHEHDHAAPTTTSDPTTALAQMPISNDKKKTPTSDNTEHAMTLADALAPLQQRERKTKKTPHSDTSVHISQPAGQEEEEDAPLGQHDRATAEDQ